MDFVSDMTPLSFLKIMAFVNLSSLTLPKSEMILVRSKSDTSIAISKCGSLVKMVFPFSISLAPYGRLVIGNRIPCLASFHMPGGITA